MSLVCECICSLFLVQTLSFTCTLMHYWILYAAVQPDIYFKYRSCHLYANYFITDSRLRTTGTTIYDAEVVHYVKDMYISTPLVDHVLLYSSVALCQHSFTDFCLHLAGCSRCIPGAGKGPRADQEAAADAESNPWLALPSQVPEDADQLCHTADLHAWIPLPAEIPTGNLCYLLIAAI